MIIFGVSRASRSSFAMRSLWLILPSASTILGDDAVTAAPSCRGPVSEFAPLAGPANWESEAGLEVIAKVRLAQCLQPDPALPISPHPLPTKRLGVSNQRRRDAGTDSALVDRPQAATPNQHPHPTTQRSTQTPTTTTTTRQCRLTHHQRQRMPSRSLSSAANSEISGSATPSTAVIGTAPLRLLVQKAPRDLRRSAAVRRRITAGVCWSSSTSTTSRRVTPGSTCSSSGGVHHDPS